MVHGFTGAGPLIIDSIMNSFSNPCEEQTIDSEQSSTAFSGILGLYFKSLEYSVRRWNM